MKLCKKCKHISYCETKCERPVGERTSLVSGNTYVGRMNNSAENERNCNWLSALIHNRCGKSGRFWEDNTEELLKRRLAVEEMIKTSTIPISQLPGYSPGAHHHGAIAKSLSQDMLQRMQHELLGMPGYHVCDGSAIAPDQFKLQTWARRTIKPKLWVEPLT